MPSINDIMEVADLLKSKPVICAEERCVAVRNRNAACRKCADACVADCIEIGQNDLIIHAEACVNCGVCTAVCPTEALVALNPLDDEVIAETLEAWQRRCAHAVAEGSPDEETPAAIIACARAAARKVADPDLFATVPCLGRIDESLLIEISCKASDRLATTPDAVLSGAAEASTPRVISSGVSEAAPPCVISSGVSEAAPPCVISSGVSEANGVEKSPSAPASILLVDGDCTTCRYGAISGPLDEACAGARALLEAFAIPATVERTSAFPSDVLLENDQQRSLLRGRERRSLVGDAKRFASSAAKATAEKAIADALHQKSNEPTLRDRLKVNPHGALPTFPATRNMAVLDALCEAASSRVISTGAAEGGEVEKSLPDTTLNTRLFGDVTIDAETCTGCGMCAMFCPTGALRFSDVAEHPEEGMRYLEFQAADCTQCNVCADVCLHHSVTVSPRVQLHEVLDFEPQLLAVPQPKKTVDVFRLKKKFQ